MVDKWVCIVMEEHNHKIEIDSVGYSGSRKLTHFEREKVSKEYLSGIKPAQILTSLKKELGSTTAISRIIYNETARVNRELKGDYSFLVSLMKYLNINNYVYSNAVKLSSSFGAIDFYKKSRKW